MAEFDWVSIQSIEDLENSRRHRFTPEMRPLLLQYFGLAPGMNVLEVGCGPGTLAPYLAEGISPGKVTGLDLDKKFVEHAARKAVALGQAAVEYVVGDAYCLPFADCTFDAVLSYTGIGVLEHPEQALHEMVRVCRPGGAVSLGEPVTGQHGTFFDGIDSVAGCTIDTYDGSERYHQLRADLRRALAAVQPGPKLRIGSEAWPVNAFMALQQMQGCSRFV